MDYFFLILYLEKYIFIIIFINERKILIYRNKMSKENKVSDKIKETIDDVEEILEKKGDLQADLEKIEVEKKELNDKNLRLIAESENLRKRYEKQLADSHKYAVTNFAKDLMSVMDNLFRTLEFPIEELMQNEEFKNLFAGIEMTKTDLVNVFKKYDIVRIMPNAGDEFDYNLHQAVSQIEDSEIKKGAIVNVIQAGYVMGDRLLRPAMVAVSA